MNIYDEMKAAGVEIDHHESDLYVPVNDTTREIVKRYPDIHASTFIDNVTQTPWYDIPFQYLPFWEEKPKWPPPGGLSEKAYRCGTCSEVFKTTTNHWGAIYTCPLCKSASRSICVEPVPEGFQRPAIPTVKTRIHYYRFNLRHPGERSDWVYLQADLEDKGVTCFKAERHRGEVLKDGTEEIEIETNHLSDNQWNSTTSRVFDWYLGTDPGTPDIRAGHWLEVTEEMRALRHNTFKCGFCGHASTASRTPFHLGCLGKAQLRETDLALLRWRRIDDTSSREPLTDAERAWLVPLYRVRQIHSPEAEAQRSIARKKFDKIVATATVERDGMLWLLDHAIQLDNVIFYVHSGRFTFGWRTSLSADEQTELKSRLAEFPFPYDMK